MPNKTLEVPRGSPLHQKLQKRITARIQLAKRYHDNQHDKWRIAEELTLAYMPETDVDAARRRRRDLGSPSYTTIQIPYTYAMLLSAHTYWTSVFFARSPVHQYQGRHGEGEQQVQALEALIGYQVDVGEFLGPYYVWMYDAPKYGHGILGHYWARETIYYGQLVEMADENGNLGLYQSTQELPGYTGNRVYPVSPYDWMHDPRVTVGNFQKGEFVCARVRLGWHQIYERKELGWYNENVKFLKDHLTDRGSTEGSSQLERPKFDLSDDMREDEKHSGGVFWEVYVQLIPSEWGLGVSNRPQKWCFTITEDEDLIVGVSPCGYAHGRFPFSVLESEIEGYGTYGRGMPEIIAPLQYTMDWLLNTHFFNVRAALNNQFIVDPSKLVVKDAAAGGPGFIWRLRPEAYGNDISKMFMQVPVSDITRANISDLPVIQNLGEKALGINDQIMGSMSQKRTTATEARMTTGFGVNRLKTIAEYMSAVGFAPHSQMLVQNSQQYYDATEKLRRVGDLALEAGQSFIDVTPDSITGFFSFVPVDGTMPIDRMAQANLWKEIMGTIPRMLPQVAAQYDWARIFGWVAPLAGLKNINQFKIQVVPDQQLQLQAQAGNVVPIRSGGMPSSAGSAVAPGNSASTGAGLEALLGGSAIDGQGY